MSSMTNRDIFSKRAGDFEASHAAIPSKEQLMIHCWRPERVERLLEAGYDIEDM
jgi:hypothetical protein